MNNTTEVCSINGDSYVKDIVTLSLSSLAIILNTIAITILCRCGGKLYSHHVLIVTQCSADISVALGYIAFSTYIRFHPSPGASLDWCVKRCLIEFVNGAFMLSLINMMMITIDRLIAVWKPLRYSSLMTKARVRIMIIVSLVFCLIGLWLTLIIMLIKYEISDVPFNCETFFSWPSYVYEMGKYIMMLDTALLVFVYTYIFCVLKSREQLVGDNINLRRVTITSLWIVLTFLVCYLPDVIYSYICPPVPYPMIVKILPYINCVFDPIIYAMRLRRIKNWIRNVFCGSGANDHLSKKITKPVYSGTVAPGINRRSAAANPTQYVSTV